MGEEGVFLDSEAWLNRERDEGFRGEQDRRLVETLVRRLKDWTAPPPLALDFPKAGEPEIDPGEIECHLVGMVELGLVLNLGYMPRVEEMAGAAEALVRNLPQLFTRVERLSTISCLGKQGKIKDPAKMDWTKLAAAVNEDGDVGFGIRDPGRWEFKIVALASESQQAQQSPAAPYVKMLLPSTSDPESLHRLALELAEVLPIRSGRLGYEMFYEEEACDENDFAVLRRWPKQYLGLEVDLGEEANALLRGSLGSAQWLTFLGTPFAEALGELSFSKGVSVERRAKALVIRAGEKPMLGEVAKGHFPHLYAEVDRVLAPFRIEAEEEAIAAPPLDVEETALWLNRLQRPDLWLAGQDR